MAAYVMVDISVNDASVYETYKRLAPSSIQAFGGRYLVRGGATEVLEGNWKPNRFVVLEFETSERARTWWASAEYAEAKSVRQSCATTNMMILVEGL